MRWCARTGQLDRLSLFIKSDGGSGQAALRMVNLLRRYVKHLTVLAPLECQSAATMLALGADRILMGPLAHLSAVDTSLTHDLSPIDRDNDRVSVSNDELLRVIRLWTEQAKDSTAESLRGAVSLRSSAGHRRGRSLQRALHAHLRRDPLLPHAGRGARPRDLQHPQLRLSLAQLPHHAARGQPHRPQRRAHGRLRSTACSSS